VRKLLLGITLAAAALAGACQGAGEVKPNERPIIVTVVVPTSGCLIAQAQLTGAESRSCSGGSDAENWRCKAQRILDISSAKRAVAANCR
jgi:hypothetical protein